MKKRLLSALLALTLIVGLLPGTAWASTTITPTSGTCGDNINWYLQQDGTLLLDGSGETYTYGGYSFQPPAPWSELADEIKTIKVQGNITRLWDGLFNECTSAVGITLPESLEYISPHAWPDGDNLQFVVTGSTGRYIAYEGVLYGTQDPDGWDNPENAVFCLIYYPPSANYTSYTLRDETAGIVGLQSKNLQKLTLNKNLKTINYISCPQLTQLEIPDGVTEIASLAFSGCTSLREFKLPSTISKLDTSIFWDCSSLESVVIPASVKEVFCPVYPYEGSTVDLTQHRDFYFCGDAPKVDNFLVADHITPVSSTWVEIRADIYYPQNSAGWTELIQSFGNCEDVKFYPYTPEETPPETPTQKYTVSYNLAGGNGGPSAGSYAAGEEVTIPTTVPVKDGYTFKWWQWSGAPVIYTPGQSFIISDQNVTLVAQWEEKKVPIGDAKDIYVDALISNSLIKADDETKTTIHNAILNLLFNAQYRPTGGPVVDGNSAPFSGTLAVNRTWPAPNPPKNKTAPLAYSIKDNVLGTIPIEGSLGCMSYASMAESYTYGTPGNKKSCGQTGAVSADEVKEFIHKWVDPGEHMRYHVSADTLHSIMFLGETIDEQGFYYISFAGGPSSYTLSVCYDSYETFARKVYSTLNVRDANNGSYYKGTATAIADIRSKKATITKEIIRIACPVEVTIRLENEILDSRIPDSTATFGTVERIEDELLFTLEHHENYALVVAGTGNGVMTLALEYYADETLIDTRTFVNFPIEPSTVTQANLFDPLATFVLHTSTDNVTEDTTWGAGINETVYGSNDDYSCKNNSREEDPVLPVTPPVGSNHMSNPSNNGKDPSYNINAPTALTGGTVTVFPTSASTGSKVTITATPTSGYELNALTATDSSGKVLTLINEGSGKYSFTMPSGKVSIDATFQVVETPWGNPFTDVSTEAWYYDAVKFVNQNGLMNGVGNGRFAPESHLSRAMLAEILYNKEGRPAVTATSSFLDVGTGAWYTDAVTWAAANSIVGGYGNGQFGPGDDITREQLAVILYRYAGSPIPPNLWLDFTDAYKVSDWAQDAMRWAVDQGILKGKGNGILDPAGKATRAEAAQMLKNYLEP